MKKAFNKTLGRLAAVFFVFIVSMTSVWAQAAVEPADEFYSLVERWEIQGLISEQPPLRPYPLKFVEEILTQVIESENEYESQQAQECYERIFNKSWKLRLNAEADLKAGDDSAKLLLPNANFAGDLYLSPLVSAAYKIGVLVTNDRYVSALPAYTSLPYFFHDAVDLKKLEAFLNMDTSFSIAGENIYGQMGLSHNSFGPFFNDSAVISPDAQHTANFSFYYDMGRVSYTQSLFGLTASNYWGESLFPEKNLAMHSINAEVFPWLTASFYEASMFGNRFEPAYLIPVPFIITQSLAGFDDNIFMGISFTVRPFSGFAWVNNVFVDDVSLNDLLRFHFDTKLRGTFQTAVKYAPADIEWLDMINLGYTLVTPYMYSHSQGVNDLETGKSIIGSKNTVNYQEYTTAGEPLGLSIPPNSHKVSISADFTPIKNLKITAGGVYLCHSNVCESLPEDEALSYLNSPEGYFTTDGTLYTHPHYFKDGDSQQGKYLSSAWNHFLFMTQPTKMHTIRASLDASYYIPTVKLGKFSAGIGYTFERIINYGVEKDIFKGLGGEYIPRVNEQGKEEQVWQGNATPADVQKSIDDWRAALTNQTNHYIRLNFRYEW